MENETTFFLKIQVGKSVKVIPLFRHKFPVANSMVLMV